jgi:phospholipid/cholesterol/gamma-HCH transport system permease protein
MAVPFRIDADRERRAVRLSGVLALEHAAELRGELRRALDLIGPGAEVDVAEVVRADVTSLALIEAELGRRGDTLTGQRGAVAEVLSLLPSPTPPAPALPRAPLVERVGASTHRALTELRTELAFVGDSLVAFARGLGELGSVRWQDVDPLAERAGADALPIISLFALLVGLNIGYQTAVELSRLGAPNLTADSVAISLTRELGPLMTAVIMTGRTGAAFTAELGTMCVNQEIDVLETLGIDPLRFLVFPRVIAMVMVMPLLTVLADVLGIFGGLVIGVFQLGIDPRSYLGETRGALGIWDILTGLIKAVFFGGAIAFIACQRGLATKGGAAGVGRSATRAVVASLLALAVLDFGLTVLFDRFGV